MSLSACPVAVAKAPAQTIWDLLSNPAGYTAWTDAIVDRLVPEGAARAGQHVIGHTALASLKLPVRIEVLAADGSKRTLDLRTQLPLGITVHNHIAVVELQRDTCQVSFG